MYSHPAEIEEDFKCCFCKHKFNDVVKLIPDCGESICGDCYDDLLKNCKETSEFRCHACQTEHSIPKKGFPDNKGFSRAAKKRRVEKALTEQAETLKSGLESIRNQLNETESFDASHYINQHCDELMMQVTEAVESEIKNLREIEESLFKQIDKYRLECQENSSANQPDKLKAELAALSSEISTFGDRWNDFFKRVDVAASDDDIEAALSSVKHFKSRIKSLTNRLKLDALMSQIMMFDKRPAEIEWLNTRFWLYTTTNSTPELRIQETPLHNMSGDLETVFQAVFLPGNKLASCSKDKSIKIWDVKEGTMLYQLKGHTKEVYSLAVLANGLLASGSSDKTIKIWDLEQRKEMRTLGGHIDRKNSLRSLKDNKLASYSADGTIRIWDLGNPFESRPLTTIKCHGSVMGLLQLGVLSNNNLVTSLPDFLSDDETILKVWEPNGKLVESVPTGLNKLVALLVLSTDQVALGYLYGAIKIIDLTDSTKSRTKENAYGSNITCFAEVSNGSLITSGCDRQSSSFKIKLWNLADLSLLQEISTGKDDLIRYLCVSTDESLLVGTTTGKTIMLWRIEKPSKIAIE